MGSGLRRLESLYGGENSINICNNKQVFSERVRVFAADIALVRFGLNDENYHFLTYEIDVGFGKSVDTNSTFLGCNPCWSLCKLGTSLFGSPRRQCFGYKKHS